jgi:hypothetical protein
VAIDVFTEDAQEMENHIYVQLANLKQAPLNFSLIISIDESLRKV